MSGSEDGQLRSPKDMLSDDYEDHDTDSLDIKPPQANTSHHSRDSTGSRRKEKSSKEKKHSKERKHREYDRSIIGVSGGERRGGEHRRNERAELERYHARNSGGYEREESREVLMSMNNERRYAKHYEREVVVSGRGGGGGGSAYYQQQQHSQLQFHQQQRQEYYERTQAYHAAEYQLARPPLPYKGHVVTHAHNDYCDEDITLHRERRKYNYEVQKDPESLEQDLRSRLLSKRHKYVKSSESEDPPYDGRKGERDIKRVYEERDQVSTTKLERGKETRQAREPETVIELLDSPDVNAAAAAVHHKRKHKRRRKENIEGVAKTSPKLPELLARRDKILAAEREKEKLKEAVREELKARREKRRRNELIDVLSPSTVAASVTAGLNVVVKRKGDVPSADDKEHAAFGDGEEHALKRRSKHKRAKLAKHKKSSKRHNSEDEEDEDKDEDSDTDDSEDSDADEEGEEDVAQGKAAYTESDSSDSDSEGNYARSKTKKRPAKPTDDIDSDQDLQLPDSPLSIGELSKTATTATHPADGVDDSAEPPRRKMKKRTEANDANDEAHSARSASAPSQHSIWHSSRSRTRSRSSNSTSRSNSHSSERSSRSRSSQSSESRSQSPTEVAEKEKMSATDGKEEKRPLPTNEQNPLAVDEQGTPLPNYYPGIQGCRSVEEFQCLNRIEEGTYGVVYRAKDKRTSEIVALKRLKMEKEKEGFPITSLREINTLLKGQHPNIVTVREIVVGSNMDAIFIVMDYVEHDLKSLMETMKNRKQYFLPGEVKCLAQQLLHAVGHLHDNWILHRDLKTSNLLLSHKGILKVGDFGLAREYGSPLKKYTSLVVTLWYRAPELLLCAPEYSTPIDIWSVGCIFAEFLQMSPMFPGKSEIDQLNRIYKELGTPNEKIWPGYKELPAVKNMLSQNSQFTEYPIANIRKRFSDKTTEMGLSLLEGLLTYDPKQRLNAEASLKHGYFKELPLPIDPSMFPTWPAKSELGARKTLAASPKPPSGGSQFKQLGRDDIIASTTTKTGVGSGTAASHKLLSGIITGNKKSAANTGFVLNAGIDQRQLAMGPGFNLKF